MNDKITTGCPILDKVGISPSAIYQRPDLCLNCSEPDCQIVSRDDDLKRKSRFKEVREVYLKCRTCGATETLTMIDGRLERTQKWLQKGEFVFHMTSCGLAEEIK